MKFSLLIASILFLSLNKHVSATITVYDEKNLTIIDYDDSAAAFGTRIPENGFKVSKNKLLPLNPEIKT